MSHEPWTPVKFCYTVGCTQEAEPNCDYCRGHEGGFLVGDKGRTATEVAMLGPVLPTLEERGPKQSDDEVHSPAHYTNGAIECIDAITEAVRGLPGIEAFCVGNAIKYLWRHDMKGGTQDLEKAKWYIDRAIAERTKRGAK